MCPLAEPPTPGKEADKAAQRSLPEAETSEGVRECLRGKRWVSSKQREAWVRGITIQEPKAVHPGWTEGAKRGAQSPKVH